MFTIVSSVAEELGELGRDGIKPLIADVGRMTRRLGETFQADLSRLMSSLNVTAQAVEKRAVTITARMDSITAELEKSSMNLGRVLSNDNVQAVRRVVANVERTSETFAATIRELEPTRRKVDELIRNVDGIVQANRGTIDKSLTNTKSPRPGRRHRSARR